MQLNVWNEPVVMDVQLQANIVVNATSLFPDSSKSHRVISFLAFWYVVIPPLNGSVTLTPYFQKNPIQVKPPSATVLSGTHAAWYSCRS